MNDAKMSDLTLEVLQQFRVIYGSMRQYFRLLEERCGLPGSQMWVLQEVAHEPGIGINDLAGRIGVHQSTASLMVDKLVGAGLLCKTRSARDQRRVGLELGEGGREVLSRLPGPAEGILPMALSSLPVVAIKTLKINLDELIAHLPGRDDAAAVVPLADQLGAVEERGGA